MVQGEEPCSSAGVKIIFWGCDKSLRIPPFMRGSLCYSLTWKFNDADLPLTRGRQTAAEQTGFDHAPRWPPFLLTEAADSRGKTSEAIGNARFPGETWGSCPSFPVATNSLEKSCCRPWMPNSIHRWRLLLLMVVPSSLIWNPPGKFSYKCTQKGKDLQL